LPLFGVLIKVSAQKLTGHCPYEQDGDYLIAEPGPRSHQNYERYRYVDV